MTFAECDAIVKKITYKPGWRISIEWTLQDNTFLIVSLLTRDSFNPEREDLVKIGFRELLPKLHTIPDTEYFLQIVRKLLGKMELHERDEWFRYDGDMIFNPHALDALTWGRAE